MDVDTVERKLIQVLQQIQATSQKPSPAISPATRPLDDLPGFDSKIWPAAVSMLAAALGVAIPADENIFVSVDGRHRLTVRDTAIRVAHLAQQRATLSPSPDV